MSSIKSMSHHLHNEPNNIELQAIEWHERLSNDVLSNVQKEALEQAFDDWMAISEQHRQAYLEAELLAEGLTQLSQQPDLLAQGSIDVSEPELEAERLSEPRVMSMSEDRTSPRNWAKLAMAACLAMVTVLSVQWFVKQPVINDVVATETFRAQYHSDAGTLKNVSLPDGSKLILGPNSLVNVRFDDSSRLVELLLGEAYFDIVSLPDRPFFVEADQASVKVVGTRFDVRRLAHTTSVSVVEGVVQVFNGKKSARLGQNEPQATTLLAGQYTKLDGEADMIVQQAVGTQDLAAWINGRLVYRGAELRDVIADANRYSSTGLIQLDTATLGDHKVTLSVNVASLDDLPLMLAELMELEVRQNASGTVLTPKP